ncbi:hypothetical protein DPEC_G00244960 [Dallia pectoralis]|uniref:Uncharacterized protein n=1 Tax=Dallia pectoralis TaxID=75939 RepID=A0ACC2FVZ5_DALPE|nr:hypothetical protein DPEC_G00244960 [Dallia pectoralis]
MQQDNDDYEVVAVADESNCGSGQSSPFRSSSGSSTSTDSRVDSQRSHTQSDNEEGDDTTANKMPVVSSIKKPDPVRKQTQNQAGQWSSKKRNSNSEKNMSLLFPPIKSQEDPNKHIRSAQRHCIQELNNKVRELQQQLTDASKENQLLKQLQSRQTVALEHLQMSQNGLPQIMAKHSNEVQALRKLLRKACIRRESLSRHLRHTEKELLNTKDALNRLQLFSKDCSLEERVELSHRLNLVTVDLDGKSKRIQDLERNLELSQISFNRHLAAESRKTSEARELSDYLQKQINKLTQKIRERERELDIHNIYAHRFQKSCNAKGSRETKSVQTDNSSPLPYMPLPKPESTRRLEYQELQMERQKSFSWEAVDTNRSDLADKPVDDRGPNDHEDLENGEHGGDSVLEDLQLQHEDNLVVKEKVSSLQVSEEQTETLESQIRYKLENLHIEYDNRTLKSPPRTKRMYTFKDTIQNLHCGKPAHSSHTHSLRRSPPKCINSQARVENLGSGVYEPSFVTLPEEKSQRCDITSPKPKGCVIQSKKSTLMKELFGQAPISDETAMQTSTSKVQTEGLDRIYNTGDG